MDLPQSLSHLVGYKLKISKREIAQIAVFLIIFVTDCRYYKIVISISIQNEQSNPAIMWQ